MARRTKTLTDPTLKPPAVLALTGIICLMVLTGCQSGGLSSYSSPRVTGRVLAAGTQQPLPGVTVRRVVRYATAGESTPPKGGQILTRPPGVRTDVAGRFVVDEVSVFAPFRRSGWHAVTLSFECPGYRNLETNFVATVFKARSPDGVPLVNAGDVLLKPVTDHE